MIKKFLCNKLIRTIAMFLLLILLVLFPVGKEYSLSDDVLVHTIKNENNSKVYLLDKFGYIAKCKVDLENTDDVNYAKKLIELLIIDGKYESKIPNDFKPILPQDLKINSIKINNNSIILDLSKEYFDLKKEYEETAIELITYNLTTISNIEDVYINIDGVKLDKLPKSNILINQPLKRNYGINKMYTQTSYKNVNKTVIYYIRKMNNEYYYVPVTKVNNDNREKIQIIIDELTSNNTYQTNLMSFLNYNAKLNKYSIDGETMVLDFNSFLFDDISSKKILEEVIYTICLSVKDNYSVKQVVFNVDNKEIIKSTLKNIE